MLISIPIPNTKSDIYTTPQINSDKKTKKNDNYEKNDINIESNKVTAQLLVNSQLTDYRYLINKNDLMNSSNQLIDYLNTIFQFLLSNYYDDGNSSNENIDINSLITFSKNYILFKNIKLSNLPWDNYQRISNKINNNSNTTNNEVHWYLYDEILACINSISSIYSQLTCDSIQFLLSEDKNSDLSNDNKWKRPSNLVKNSFVFLKIIGDYNTLAVNNNNNSNSNYNSETNETINNLHQLNYNINLHYSNFLIQIIVLIKDIWLIDLNDYQLNQLPKFNNTYLRILIYINNEFKILKNLLISTFVPTSSSSQSSLNYSLNSIQIFLNSMLCYYLSINYYYKNSPENQNLGISIGLIRYVLLNTLDQDKLISKFKTTSSISSSLDKKANGDNTKESKFKKLINLKKDTSNNNSNNNNNINENKNNKDSKKSIDIFKETKLNKLINNNLDNYLKILLIKLINLLKLLNFKFEKENNNLKFDKILNNSNEIESNYLFNSNNLPTGLNIPINFIKFNPTCLSSLNNTQINNNSFNSSLNSNSNSGTNYF
ncbi:unnamed protein product [[Candida] boidinii]|nr:unnamed protein product [[Candida] boidinii]